MSTHDLSFADNTFTHSINNLFPTACPTPLKPVYEIYRTIKPGHTAIVTYWAWNPQDDAIKTANEKLRGEKQLQIMIEWQTSNEGWLQAALRTMGFSSVKVDELVV
jgi:hypothetical protein